MAKSGQYAGVGGSVGFSEGRRRLVGGVCGRKWHKETAEECL